MIYLNEPSNNRQEFENLLQYAKGVTLLRISSLDRPENLSGTEFESIVYEAVVESSLGTMFEGKLVHTADREFPDIVAADYFGIEVKATKKNDWTSIGNSVLESSRVLKIEKIYIFFGKLGGRADIKFRNYEECLKGIAVTHYPRYQIDMTLPEGQSIFSKMRIGYDDLRQRKNPVKPIRAYYQSILKEGQDLWWINDSLDDSTAPSPIIKSLSSLEINEKRTVLAVVMVLFPEIFSNELKKYKRVAPYLAAKYGVVSSSLRDEFSAGGAARVTYKGKGYTFPHVIGEMIKSCELIETVLNEQNISDLAEQWGRTLSKYRSTSLAWMAEIDLKATHHGFKIKLSELYEAALKGGVGVTFK